MNRLTSAEIIYLERLRDFVIKLDTEYHVLWDRDEASEKVFFYVVPCSVDLTDLFKEKK